MARLDNLGRKDLRAPLLLLLNEREVHHSQKKGQDLLQARYCQGQDQLGTLTTQAAQNQSTHLQSFQQIARLAQSIFSFSPHLLLLCISDVQRLISVPELPLFIFGKGAKPFEFLQMCLLTLRY